MTADAAGFHIDLARDDLDDIDEGEAMIDIKLPLRLVSEANAHEHWRRRQQRAKNQRDIACMVTRGTLQSLPYRHPWTPLTVTITRIAPRQLDSDNNVGSAKHVRDGVADALGINDRDPRVTWLYAQERGKPGEYAVRVKIEAKGEAA